MTAPEISVEPLQPNKKMTEPRSQQTVPKPTGWHRTSQELLAYHESRLLRHLQVPFRVYHVPLRSNNPELIHLSDEFINTLEVTPEDDVASMKKPTIVVIDGHI